MESMTVLRFNTCKESGGRLTGLEKALSSGGRGPYLILLRSQNTCPGDGRRCGMMPRAKAGGSPAPPLGKSVDHVPLPEGMGSRRQIIDKEALESLRVEMKTVGVGCKEFRFGLLWWFNGHSAIDPKAGIWE